MYADRLGGLSFVPARPCQLCVAYWSHRALELLTSDRRLLPRRRKKSWKAARSWWIWRLQKRSASRSPSPYWAVPTRSSS